MSSDSPSLGRLLYQARCPLWVTLLSIPLYAFAFYVSIGALIQQWSDLNWLQTAIFVFLVLATPFLPVYAVNRRVLFYDRGMVVRAWNRELRTVDYHDVTFVARDPQLYIHVADGRPVEISRGEGNFDRIEEIIVERRAAAPELDS